MANLMGLFNLMLSSIKFLKQQRPTIVVIIPNLNIMQPMGLVMSLNALEMVPDKVKLGMTFIVLKKRKRQQN